MDCDVPLVPPSHPGRQPHSRISLASAAAHARLLLHVHGKHGLRPGKPEMRIAISRPIRANLGPGRQLSSVDIPGQCKCQQLVIKTKVAFRVRLDPYPLRFRCPGYQPAQLLREPRYTRKTTPRARFLEHECLDSDLDTADRKATASLAVRGGADRSWSCAHALRLHTYKRPGTGPRELTVRSSFSNKTVMTIRQRTSQWAWTYQSCGRPLRSTPSRERPAAFPS